MTQRTQAIIALVAGLALLTFAVGLIFWTSQPAAAISVRTEPLLERSGAAVIVTGTHFPANREIYIGLADPDVPPMAGISFARTSSDRDGKFQATFPFPADPRWTELTEVTVYAGTPEGDAVATARLSLGSLARLLTPAPLGSATPLPAASPTLVRPSATATASAPPPPTAVPIPAISLKPSTGRVGTAVVVTGRGWRANETVLVSLLGYGAQSTVDLGTAGTDAQGGLAATFIFPANWIGPSATIVLVHHQDNSEQAMAVFQVVGLVTPTVQTPTPLVITGWLGQYHSNQTLSGAPVLMRNDDNLDFDWGNGSPAPGLIPEDHFSARWTRTMYFPPGPSGYRFWAAADDGVRIWLDGNRLIDEWHLAANTPYSADVLNLVEGQHTLKVEYYEEAGQAKVHVWWQPLPTPTPTFTTTPTPTSTTTVTATGVITPTQ